MRGLFLAAVASLALTTSTAVATTATPVGSVGACISENAEGTPKGAECRCQASGPNARCSVDRGYSGMAMCSAVDAGGHVRLEMCAWLLGTCSCTDVGARGASRD